MARQTPLGLGSLEAFSVLLLIVFILSLTRQ